MVKKQNELITDCAITKGFNGNRSEPREIKAYTGYRVCQKQVNPFGEKAGRP